MSGLDLVTHRLALVRFPSSFDRHSGSSRWSSDHSSSCLQAQLSRPPSSASAPGALLGKDEYRLTLLCSCFILFFIANRKRSPPASSSCLGSHICSCSPVSDGRHSHSHRSPSSGMVRVPHPKCLPGTVQALLAIRDVTFVLLCSRGSIVGAVHWISLWWLLICGRLMSYRRLLRTARSSVSELLLMTRISLRLHTVCLSADIDDYFVTFHLHAIEKGVKAPSLPWCA